MSESKKVSKKRRRADERFASKGHPPPSLPTGRCVHVSERYEKLGRLGEGTYGIVYKARDRTTGQLVALKRCIPHNESSDGFPITTLREIESLRVCRGHPNVVHLERVAVSKTGVFLVFENCDHDLANLIDSEYSKHRRSPFATEGVKRLLLQLLSALDFVHAHFILHRDIKLSNLLYNNKGMLKLADFGLSRRYSAEHPSAALTPNVASLWYRPPELLLGASKYTASIDSWASGCIFAELLNGYPLLNGKTEMDQIHKIFECLGVPTASEWPSFADLPLVRDGSIQPLLNEKSSGPKSLLDDFAFLGSTGLRLLASLLHFDPSQRWSVDRALESPYFREEPLPTPVERMPRFRAY